MRKKSRCEYFVEVQGGRQEEREPGRRASHLLLLPSFTTKFNIFYTLHCSLPVPVLFSKNFFSFSRLVSSPLSSTPPLSSIFTSSSSLPPSLPSPPLHAAPAFPFLPSPLPQLLFRLLPHPSLPHLPSHLPHTTTSTTILSYLQKRQQIGTTHETYHPNSYYSLYTHRTSHPKFRHFLCTFRKLEAIG